MATLTFPLTWMYFANENERKEVLWQERRTSDEEEEEEEAISKERSERKYPITLYSHD